MKDIHKGLRELKKSSTMAFKIFNLFSEERESSAVSFWYVSTLVISNTNLPNLPNFTGIRICGIIKKLHSWIAALTVKFLQFGASEIKFSQVQMEL